MDQERRDLMRAQGAKIGHADGKARCGVYVIDEEHEMADEAMRHVRNARDAFEREVWGKGYRAGYRLGAGGEALPAEYVDNAPRQ